MANTADTLEILAITETELGIQSSIRTADIEYFMTNEFQLANLIHLVYCSLLRYNLNSTKLTLCHGTA